MKIVVTKFSHLSYKDRCFARRSMYQIDDNYSARTAREDGRRMSSNSWVIRGFCLPENDGLKGYQEMIDMGEIK